VDAKVRILNLEDNARESELIRARLEAEGVACELVRVETETDYLRALEQDGFDLIIADPSLPSLDGVRGLELARQRRPEIPFLFFSGPVGAEAAIESLLNGAVDYVLKQRPERLAGSVRRALKQADSQRQRRRAEEALRVSEARFRLIAETIDEVFWVIDVDFDKVTYISPGYARVWGRAPEDLYRDPGSFSAALHPEDRERVLASFGGQRCGEPFDLEYRIVRPDGSVRWIHDRGFPVEGILGKPHSYVGVAQDITGRKILEEQFWQAQKMEAVGRLAGGVAHDFNNLLMVINGFSDLLLKELDARGPFHEQITEIRKAGQRAADITRQLLVLSRRPVQAKVLDLNRLVGDIEKMLRRLIGEDVKLMTVLSPDLGRVMADPTQLTQLLMNLVLNSRDAMPKGGNLTIGTANIDIDETYSSQNPESRPMHYVQLTVIDTGTGIDAQTRAHLFEPFFTTKKTGEGTGLGLATVYGVVKQAGGFIEVYSEPEKITTFKVYLPRVEDELDVAETPGIAAAQTLQATETILLVEGQPDLRRLARIVLQDHGYKVLEAANASEALFHSGRHGGPIHLMVTDVVMPGMNGWDLAERMKPMRPDMKVLFLSGYTVAAMVDGGGLRADVHLLQKPVSPADLAAEVRGALGAPLPADTVRVV
jgi:two-component system cell cycle sensor histidine kinase/response regulator CckA